MKQAITLSLIAVALLATGCDQKTKNEVSDATSAVGKSIQEKAGEAADDTKDAASNAADAVKETASEATDTAKEAINP